MSAVWRILEHIGAYMKKFPLQEVGEYFEKLGKLNHAKYTYHKAYGSPMASKIDRDNAIDAIRRVDEKLREKSLSMEDTSPPAHIETSVLRPHPNVNMPMSDEDYNRLKEDVKERGVKHPLTIDTKNRIVCGIHRWKAAIEAGISRVPCNVIVIDPESAKDYAISDNLCRRHLPRKDRSRASVELKRSRPETAKSVRGRKKSLDWRARLAAVQARDGIE